MSFMYEKSILFYFLIAYLAQKNFTIIISSTCVQAADTEGEGDSDKLDGKLNFAEFSALFKELSARPELQMLFNKYSSKMEWLTVKDLQKFLQIEQGADNPSLEFCTQLIQKYEPTDEGKAQVLDCVKCDCVCVRACIQSESVNMVAKVYDYTSSLWL